jgi:dihydrofolate reductase
MLNENNFKEPKTSNSPFGGFRGPLSLIVATSTNNAIGKDNKMLWHLPEDFKYFKNTTWGMPIIMGRKTFESIGKALPGRTNIVITNNKNWQAAGVEVAHSLEDAITLAAKTNATEIFITGGAEIYKQSMAMADKIYITKVNTHIDGDAFFPEIDESLWHCTFEKNIIADEKNAFDMSFQHWEKK